MSHSPCTSRIVRNFPQGWMAVNSKDAIIQHNGLWEINWSLSEYGSQLSALDVEREPQQSQEKRRKHRFARGVFECKGPNYSLYRNSFFFFPSWFNSFWCSSWRKKMHVFFNTLFIVCHSFYQNISIMKTDTFLFLLFLFNYCYVPSYCKGIWNKAATQ